MGIQQVSTENTGSKPREQPISHPYFIKQGRQEAQVILQRIIIMFILHIILSSSSRLRATRIRRQGILRISNIGVHKLYYKTRALFSSTSSQFYDIDKDQLVKVIVFYNYAMESNTLLFDITVPKIGHSWVRQTQFASTYIPSCRPVIIYCKEQKHCIKPVFLISRFRN